MRNLISKLMIITIIFLLGILAVQVSVYASNENIEIIQKSNNDYLIYIKDNLTTDFEFAFSNDKNIDKESLSYKVAETDSTNSNANKVAYVNSVTIGMFEQPTYMWAKDSDGNYFVEGVEIDLSKSINENDLEFATNIGNIIEVDTTKTQTTTEEVDGKKITTTVGKVVLTNTTNTNSYSYLLIKLPNSDAYNELANLGIRISKFNSETDMYTKIIVYKSFLELFNELFPVSEDSNWNLVENNEILQPSNTEDGEQYVLWIKETSNGNIVNQDLQILTSSKEYSEEKIVETIITKSPITYDNNTLLFALIALVIATILVFIKIKSIEKKEEK